MKWEEISRGRNFRAVRSRGLTQINHELWHSSCKKKGTALSARYLLWKDRLWVRGKRKECLTPGPKRPLSRGARQAPCMFTRLTLFQFTGGPVSSLAGKQDIAGQDIAGCWKSPNCCVATKSSNSYVWINTPQWNERRFHGVNFELELFLLLALGILEQPAW